MIEPQLRSEFSDQNILVVGVARDCEKTIQSDIQTLFESLKGCNSLAWLVVESDSSDQSAELLRGLEQTVPNFRSVSLGSLRDTMPLRTQRIAHCRNVYLDRLNSDSVYSGINYVVVADLDGVNDLVTVEGFASCWERSDWDVCTANQKGPYYDIWALRHRRWNPNDYLQEFAFLRAHGVHREISLWSALLAKMITIGEMEDWIEVDSAFGGLAIYRKAALSGTHYIGIDEAGNEICEHVPLNSQIRSNGFRIFINPRLINSAANIHTHERTLTQCVRRLFLDVRQGAKRRILNGLRWN